MSLSPTCTYGRRRLRDLSDTERIVPALPLDDSQQGGRTMQRFKFSAAEFLGSNDPERAEKCREFAAEAEGLAAAAINPETRKAYLELKRQWLDLAAEVDKHKNVTATHVGI